MRQRWTAVLAARAPAATVLVRLMVGIVFFAEDAQKFLDPARLGPGRFAEIGIPRPELTGPFVGCVETACGLLVLLGLATRLAGISVTDSGASVCASSRATACSARLL